MREIIKALKYEKGLDNLQLSDLFTNYFKGNSLIEYSGDFASESKREEIREIKIKENNLLIILKENGKIPVHVNFDWLKT